MKCEVILAREGGYEFYTNVKCRPYPPPYYCVRVTRTPRWAEDFIYPRILRVYDSFKVDEEHEKIHHTILKKRMNDERLNKQTKIQSLRGVFRAPGRGRVGRKAYIMNAFYAIRIPIRRSITASALKKYQEAGVSITLEECEFGKYLEVKKVYDFSLREMREPVNKIATKLRVRYNQFDLIAAIYIKLKIFILGKEKETKKYL